MAGRQRGQAHWEAGKEVLQHVLRNYISGLRNERQFDAPFGLLLAPCGFEDIHYTHGVVEFGKDFIAKRNEGNQLIQYSFQLKRGAIDLPEWTNRIQNQMLQSVMTPIRHPSFDRDLKHQAVLVTTGEINPIAAQAVDELNSQIVQQYDRMPILVWTQRTLIDLILSQGLDSMLAATIEGFAEYADFYQLYSQAMKGDATFERIESDSKRWLSRYDNFEKWALWCSLESEALAQQFVSSGRFYEAIHVHLGRLRAICAAAYEAQSQDLPALFRSALPSVVELASAYVRSFKEAWEPARDMLSSDLPSTDFIGYRVQCSRVLECASLGYWLSDDQASRTQFAEFVCDIVTVELGCAQPISDRYAVSVALASLVLVNEWQLPTLELLLCRATEWLCDRYEQGIGIATVDSSEKEEIETLLGYRFDFTKVSTRRDSLLATIIRDASVVLGNADVYSDIGNDFEAVGIFPEYYQSKDTLGACLVEGADVLRYPTVGYREKVSDWIAFEHSSYAAEECREYRFTNLLGTRSTVILTMLLRDRYFPGIWSSLFDKSVLDRLRDRQDLE